MIMVSMEMNIPPTSTMMIIDFEYLPILDFNIKLRNLFNNMSLTYLITAPESESDK